MIGLRRVDFAVGRFVSPRKVGSARVLEAATREPRLAAKSFEPAPEASDTALVRWEVGAIG